MLKEEEYGDLIGLYKNPAGTEPHIIAVTERGLLLVGSKKDLWIGFSEMESVHGPERKGSDSTISIRLRTAEKIALKIAGGDGNFQDVFGFVRFVSRVLDDLKSDSDP